MRGCALALLLAALPLPATARPLWVEVVGHAAQSGPADQDSARRRAMADALLAAALAGGADVRGHTAVQNGRVTADLAIVRPVGRVLRHVILSERQDNGLWQTRIRALVGPRLADLCEARHTLIVTAFAPEIFVSPAAPAWAEPLARDIHARLVDRLGRNPAIRLAGVSAQPLAPVGFADGSYDYATLTRGRPRLAEGDHGFVADIRLAPVAAGGGDALELVLTLRLVSGSGTAVTEQLTRRVRLPRPQLFGQLAVATARTRRQMAETLSDGVPDALTALLTRESCQPAVARMRVTGGVITVPMGRRHGLTAGSLAFTADADSTTELLEIVALTDDSATLRPLDAGTPPKRLAGRPVRFLETGL